MKISRISYRAEKEERRDESAKMTCEACKTIPQVVVDNYQIKGEYKDIGGLKTCKSFHLPPSPFLPPPSTHPSNPDITGPRTSTSALLTIYDIFGLAPQTLQGADLLSQALNCLVFVPDFLKGRYAQEEFFGKISDPEVEKRKGEFWAILGFEENLALLGRWMEGVKGREGFEDVRDWGALGLCWGGKVSFYFFYFNIWDLLCCVLFLLWGTVCANVLTCRLWL